MRDVFHCTPSELAEQDHELVRMHYEIAEALRKREEKQVKYEQLRSKHGTR